MLYNTKYFYHLLINIIPTYNKYSNTRSTSSHSLLHLCTLDAGETAAAFYIRVIYLLVPCHVPFHHCQPHLTCLLWQQQIIVHWNRLLPLVAPEKRAIFPPTALMVENEQ